MNAIQRFAALAATAALAFSLAACGGMTPRQRDAAAGAAIGGVAGSVLTNGSAAGTVGGAVIGGVIGDQNGKHR